MTPAGRFATRDGFTVSVIIPTRDRPDLLARTLKSVFAQTRPPDEIIIVDDASTMPLHNVFSAFSPSREEKPGARRGSFYYRLASRGVSLPVPRLLWHRLARPLGGGAARNTGAALARGDILMFLDDDDTWLPEKTARQLAVFRDNSDVGLVYSGRRVVDEQGRLIFTVYPEAAGAVHRLLLQRNVIGVTSAVALRRKVFHDAGGFDPELPARQDYDLWIRAAGLAPVAFDGAATVNWMVHSKPGRQVSSRPDNYRRAIEIIFGKYRQAFATLEPVERRRAFASQYVVLAEKYGQAGRFPAQAATALRALAIHPSPAALSRLLPYPLWLKLRRLLEQRRT